MPNRFVRKLVSFTPLSVDAVTALQQVTAHPRKVAARTDLIREGDRPGPVFVILEGWAFRYKILPNGGRQVMAFLMPGDACDLHIGMLAEMDHGIQTATAAKVATISQLQMERIMHDHADVARAMYSAQLTDEGTLRAWIVSMGRRSSIERVAHLMSELYVRACSLGITDGSEFVIPIAQNVLADALGMTTVHINRVLQELKSGGTLTLRRGSLLILDPVSLVKIAGFNENYLHRRVPTTIQSRRMNKEKAI
jgi:CRP-like cAMP-binding protein